MQQYINRPYLIDGLKFDLRIYVLVLGVDPLRILLYKDGLTRLATEPYVEVNEDNVEDRFKNIHFISYNASNADKQLFDAVNKCDMSKKNLYIIFSFELFLTLLGAM